MNELFKKYTHQSWDDISQCGNEKYYFVKISDDIEKDILEAQYQLEIEIPEALKAFYRNVGYGFLLFSFKQKKGLYRILSPKELLDLYFEPDVEGSPDDFITYRNRAWENLEGDKLLAFCLFGEEDSLLYIGAEDGCVYYLSSARKIADSLDAFLNLLDGEADYFMN